MKITPVTDIPDTPTGRKSKMYKILIELATELPGQWCELEDHGFAESTVRPLAARIKSSQAASAANAAADAGGGTWDTSTRGNRLFVRFIPAK